MSKIQRPKGCHWISWHQSSLNHVSWCSIIFWNDRVIRSWHWIFGGNSLLYTIRLFFPTMISCSVHFLHEIFNISSYSDSWPLIETWRCIMHRTKIPYKKVIWKSRIYDLSELYYFMTALRTLLHYMKLHVYLFSYPSLLVIFTFYIPLKIYPWTLSDILLVMDEKLNLWIPGVLFHIV
jgi:hypothetical protein